MQDALDGARTPMGGGIIEQTETAPRYEGGRARRPNTLTNRNARRLDAQPSATSVSGDGLTKTVQTDSTGHGVFHHSICPARRLVVAAPQPHRDGRRT